MCCRFILWSKKNCELIPLYSIRILYIVKPKQSICMFTIVIINEAMKCRQKCFNAVDELHYIYNTVNQGTKFNPTTTDDEWYDSVNGELFFNIYIPTKESNLIIIVIRFKLRERINTKVLLPFWKCPCIYVYILSV